MRDHICPTNGQCPICNEINNAMTTHGSVERKEVEKQEASSVPLDLLVIRKDLDKFKVDEFRCAGWIVAPPVEKWLKQLCKKHNELIEYLAVDV